MFKSPFLVLLILTGCVSPRTFSVPEGADLKKKDFPARTSIPPEDVRFLRPFKKIKDVDFVVLRSTSSKSGIRYENFIRTSLEQLGFSHVMSDKDFVEMLVQTTVAERPHSEDFFSIPSLYKISRYTPSFLYIETHLDCAKGNCEQDLNIIDPAKSEHLVSMDRSQTLWTNVDGEFNYPLANLLRRWYYASVEASR